MTSGELLIDTMTRSELVQLQEQRLRSLLAEIIPRNRFWSTKFDEAGLVPADAANLANLAKLPLTTKAEILADQQSHPPYGSNLTYGPDDYSRMHQTSGTTGKPVRWLDTPTSWQRLLETWGQLFRLMGLRKDDRIVFAFSFGPFLGFWAGFEGAQRLGNFCLPAGGMSSEARLQMLIDNEATIVACTPTYALRLAEVAHAAHIDLAASAVRAILVAGEPGGNIPATRSRIEEAWGARVIDHWGMTELGPLAIEPEERPGGLAVLETECIAEIIDPVTGASAPLGAEGELVITNLNRWGSPLIRYRTGDRVRGAALSDTAPPFLFLEGGILGRVDEMLTIRGNNVYPEALEDAIRQFVEVAEFRVVVTTERSMQHVRIEIEPAPVLSPDRLASLPDDVGRAIRGRWHFQAEVVTVPCGTLPRFEMKARRVVISR